MSDTHTCCVCRRELALECFRPRSRKGWVDADGVRRSSQCVACVREVSQRATASEIRRQRGSMIEGRALMPAEPFRVWLIRKRLEFDREHPRLYRGREAVGSTGQFPEYIGIEERYIRRVMRGQQRRVSLSLVDAALVHEGSTGLWELYPELYPDTEVAA